MNDGALIFNTRIDNSNLAKDLAKVKQQIQREMANIAKMEAAKMPLLKQSEQLGVELDIAKQKLYEMQASASKTSIAEQEKVVAGMQREWDNINNQIDRYNTRIAQSKQYIEAQEAKAGRISQQLASGGAQFAQAMKTAQGSVNKLTARLGKLVANVMFFTVATAALRAVKDYMGKVLKTNDEYVKQLAQLKGALLTAFQPIYELLLPAIITLMKLATRAVQNVAQFAAALGGKSASEYSASAKALYEEAKAIDKIGKAQKSLAGFDEIAKLGGAANTSDTGNVVSPEFGVAETAATKEMLDDILEIVVAIGVALLAWKVSSMFTESLSLVGGIALIAGGTLLYAVSCAEALTEGIDWENFAGMLVGAIALVGGLALIGGTTAAAVGLLAVGIGFLVVAIADFIKTGEMSWETLATLEAGLLAIGVAISLLTGSWIPLIIAAVVGAIALIATKGDEIKALLLKLDNWLQNVFATDWTETFGIVLGGAMNSFFAQVSGVWNVIKEIFSGFIDFISGVFAGDWKRALNGLATMIIAPFKGAINTVIGLVNDFIKWLNERLSFSWKGLSLLGQQIIPAGSFTIGKIPTIPYLAKGAVIPPNREFLAVLGDQKHGTNIEAPLETIQEAVALVMEDMTGGMMAGFEATVAVLKEILEAVYGIEIGDDVIGKAVARYNSKMATARGG